MSQRLQALDTLAGATAVGNSTEGPGASSWGQNGQRRDAVVALVQRIFFGKPQGSIRRVLFCNVDHGWGSTEICACAGEILSAMAQVCIVDGLVDRDGIHRDLECNPENSNAADCSGKVARRVSAGLWSLSRRGMPSNGNGFRSVDALRVQLRDLSSRFDYILVDAPPLAACDDAILLARETDGLVLVIEADSTRRIAARKAWESLGAANVTLLGTVLNNRRFPIPERIYRRL